MKDIDRTTFIFPVVGSVGSGSMVSMYKLLVNSEDFLGGGVWLQK